MLGQHITISIHQIKTASSMLVHCWHPLTELINENTLSLATKLSIVPFKLFLTVLVVSVPA